jgi:hypothetical protein
MKRAADALLANSKWCDTVYIKSSRVVQSLQSWIASDDMAICAGPSQNLSTMFFMLVILICVLRI